MRFTTGRLAVFVALVGLGCVAAAAALAATSKGPSSSDPPYVLPVHPDASTVSILTTGDSVNTDPAAPALPYRLAGIPDGLGAFDNGDGTFTLLANHELPATAGRVRAHGATGAFVSKWTIDKATLRVQKGQDLIQQIALAPGGVYAPPAKGVALGRLCSANLPDLAALFSRKTRRGYDGRLFMNGEEVGTEGRAFAHALDGTSWELPSLGKFSWENSVASPDTQNKTVVIGLDDGTPGEVYVYVGDKRDTGTPVERAGLVGGKLYGVKVAGLAQEADATFPAPGTRFELVDLGDVAAKTGAQLQADATAGGVTRWQRPEDGSWNPERTHDFYWATTASTTGRSRLWRLRFDSVKHPEQGGTVDMLLDGTEGQLMMDNVTVDTFGRVLIQEDPGNNPRFSKIWSYSIKQDTLTEVAQHDPARFVGAANQDEESSGIIPADDILGPGWYLFDTQWHQARDTELVEGGQLQVLSYPPAKNGGNDDDNDDSDD
jgi:hypothetical protein